MLLLYPLHSLSPPSFFLLLRDLGVTDVLGAFGTFGTLVALAFWAISVSLADCVSSKPSPFPP